MTAIVWFRRDLRVRDHPALRRALSAHDAVLPVFCLDDRLLRGRHASGPRARFMAEALGDLDRSLRERGSRLIVRREAPETALPALAREVGATAVYAGEDVGPFARARDRRVAEALELVLCPGLAAVDDLGAIRTGSGGPYTVFTPFHKSWERVARRAVLAAPRAIESPRVDEPGVVPAPADLGGGVPEPLPGGETEGRQRLRNFLRGPIERYRDDHDVLGDDASSRLSPYLHFGCVSAREVEERLPAGRGAEAFRRQLAWRDFHHHVLLGFPRNAVEEMQERYRHRLDWSDDEGCFDAWCEGRTGYPLVDAGMRQLLREGWMHNRARLVVASFLTKDLGIDWRLGERWFMRMLLDGDEANNNGNWQWIASVGADPAPHYRRLYNPTRQMETLDPRGAYVRRYVPELRGVPDEYLREPWTMPAELQRECGCAIGTDYPAPIVDHREAREEALARYRAAAGARADTSRL
ncbi:MAG: cryptochrome/photolyase family protein [Thermoleophilaceae bacterium]